jgi:trimeric autotransporter adhesin
MISKAVRFSKIIFAFLMMWASLGATFAFAQNGGQINTVAGGFTGDGGLTSNAALSVPNAVAVDSAGNLYIADTDNNRIRKVAPNLTISTFAGNGSPGFGGDGGLATLAQLQFPKGLAFDSAGNLYIADTNNNRIRMVTPGGQISTFAGTGSNGFGGDGGQATSAQLNQPVGLAFDAAGNLYFSDQFNQRIRMVTTAGVISTFAGSGTNGFADGPAASAQFSQPSGIAFDSSGNLFVADFFNNRIRKIANGTVSTVVGNGTFGFGGDGGAATSATMRNPNDVKFDATGNFYIADQFNHRIRKVTGTTISTFVGTSATVGLIQGYSGDNGPATSAQLDGPSGIAFDPVTGTMYIAEQNNNIVRKVTSGGTVSTYVGGFLGDNGPATAAALHNPQGIALDASNNLYIAESFRIRKVTTGGTISTFAGTGNSGGSGDGGQAASARIGVPSSIVFDSGGNMFIASSSLNSIRKVATTGIITTVAGSTNGTSGFAGDNGLATSAVLNQPRGMAFDSLGNLFFADTNNNVIRRIDHTTGNITTVAGNQGLPAGFAGDGGLATSAQLNSPRAVVVDSLGNLYIADSNNSRIRMVTAANNNINTILGTGSSGYNGDGGPPVTSATIGFVNALAIDANGNLYIPHFSRVRKLTPGGVISTIAGAPPSGFGGDGGPATNAQMSGNPSGVAIDSQGNLFFSDTGNNRVRKVNLPSNTPTLTALTPNSGTLGAQVTVTATGTNFLQPMTVSINGGAGNPVTVLSTTSATYAFTIPQSGNGLNRVTVSTTNGTSNSLTFAGNQGPSATVTGTIQNANAVALQGARVFAQTPQVGNTPPQFLASSQNPTDASGNFSFSLPANTSFNIFVDQTSTPGVTFASPAVNTGGISVFTSAASGGTTPTGTFKGISAVTLTGTIQDSSGNPIQGARAFAQTVPNGPTPPTFLGGAYNGTDSNGNFTFSIPASTTFQITVDPSSTPGATFKQPAVNTNGVSVFTSASSGTTSAGIFKGISAVTVTGIIQDGSGNILTGARAFAQTPQNGNTPPQYLGSAFNGTDSTGKFSFSVPASTTFQIFIDPTSTPGVTFATPGVNTAGVSVFVSGSSGTTNTGTFKGVSSVTVTGTIQNSSGTNLTGARVFAQTQQTGNTPSQFLGSAYNGTDSSGNFSFSVPANTTFQLFIDPTSTPGVTFKNPAVNTNGVTVFTSASSGSTSTGTFKGTSSVTVTGTIQDGSGTNLTGARVFAQTQQSGNTPPQFLGGQFNGTDANGGFSFAIPANTTFQLFIDPTSTPGVTFKNPAANTGGVSVFTSAGSGSTTAGIFKGLSSVTVTGTIQDGLGNALTGGRVFAQTLQNGNTPPLFLGGAFNGTDSSGNFSFSVPSNTTFQIFVDPTSTPGVTFKNPAVNTGNVSVFTAGGSGTVTAGTFKGLSAVTVTGTVQDGSGNALTGARVFAQTLQNGATPPLFLGGAFNGTDANGGFSFSIPANTTFQIFVDPTSTPGVTFANPATNTAGVSSFTSGASGTTNTGTFKGLSSVTLTGTLQDSGGNALVGARVFAQTPPTGATLPKFLGGAFNGTDSNGNYSFSVPSNTTFQIFVDPTSTPGVTFANPAVNTGGVSVFTSAGSGTTSTGTFKGVSSVTITGTIQDSSGTALTGARVFAQTLGSPNNPPKFLGGSFSGTDSNGNFSFSIPASTTFQIFVDPTSTPGVTFPSPAVNTAGLSQFTSGASGTTATGTFKGVSSVTITGTIQDGSGTALVGAKVFAQSTPGPGSPAKLLGGAYGGTDNSGAFSFTIPANSTFQIFVDPTTTPGVTFANPAVNTGGTSSFLAPASGSFPAGTFKGTSAVTITGHVQDASGNPIAGAIVFAQTPPAPDGTSKFLGGGFGGTDANGMFSFTVPVSTALNIFVDPFSTPGFTFPAPAVNTALGSSFNSPAIGTLDTGTFKGVAAVTLTGTVQNLAGVGVAGAFVFAQDSNSGKVLGGAYKFTDNNGAFSFPVPAGSSFKLFISATGLTFASPAVNTNNTSSFTAPGSGTLNTGTFKATGISP